MSANAKSLPLSGTLNESLLQLAARIIAGDISESEALDLLEAVALNAPNELERIKIGRGSQ